MDRGPWEIPELVSSRRRSGFKHTKQTRGGEEAGSQRKVTCLKEAQGATSTAGITPLAPVQRLCPATAEILTGFARCGLTTAFRCGGNYYLQAVVMGEESVRSNFVYPEELRKPPELPCSSGEGGAWGRQAAEAMGWGRKRRGSVLWLNVSVEFISLDFSPVPARKCFLPKTQAIPLKALFRQTEISQHDCSVQLQVPTRQWSKGSGGFSLRENSLLPWGKSNRSFCLVYKNRFIGPDSPVRQG